VAQQAGHCSNCKGLQVSWIDRDALQAMGARMTLVISPARPGSANRASLRARTNRALVSRLTILVLTSLALGTFSLRQLHPSDVQPGAIHSQVELVHLGAASGGQVSDANC